MCEHGLPQDECSMCQADVKLAEIRGVCECYFDCAENPSTGCSLTGSWHVHAGEPCAAHPDAPGDR